MHVLKQLARPRASHSCQIALAGSRRLRSMSAATTVLFAHAVVKGSLKQVVSSPLWRGAAGCETPRVRDDFTWCRLCCWFGDRILVKVMRAPVALLSSLMNMLQSLLLACCFRNASAAAWTNYARSGKPIAHGNRYVNSCRFKRMMRGFALCFSMGVWLLAEHDTRREGCSCFALEACCNEILWVG